MEVEEALPPHRFPLAAEVPSFLALAPRVCTQFARVAVAMIAGHDYLPGGIRNAGLTRLKHISLGTFPNVSRHLMLICLYADICH